MSQLVIFLPTEEENTIIQDDNFIENMHLMCYIGNIEVNLVLTTTSY